MTKKFKVLRTIESFYPFMSGPANQAYRLSRELEKKGIRSPIFTTRYKVNKRPKHEKAKGVEVFRFSIKRQFMKFFYTPDMKEGIEKMDPDVIHAHSYRGYQTQIAYKMARKLGKGFVISTHGSLLGYTNYLKGLRKIPYLGYDFLGKKIVKNADAVVVNSKKEHRDAIKFGVKKEKIHLIPVGINVELYKPLKKGKTLRVLFVGRISRNRNIEPIIRAAEMLMKKRLQQKIVFDIVGGEAKSSEGHKTGYVKEMKALAKDLGLKNTVRFAGEKRDAELRRYYRKSDIFVYTSMSENFGQTMLEASAAGLPLICTKVGIAPELIKNGKNGFIIKGRPEEIVKHILYLKDKKIRERFGKLTRKTVKKNFDWKEIMKMYLQIYKSVMRN